LSLYATSSLRLKSDLAGNTSEVATWSYTMAVWQHESKHVDVWPLCPMRAESESEQATSF